MFSAEDSIKRLLSLANKDCYTVMGVTPDANQADIKKVYRQQAILVHPDKTSHPGGDAAFKILAQAFETVGDPEKRSVSQYIIQIQIRSNLIKSDQIVQSKKPYQIFP